MGVGGGGGGVVRPPRPSLVTGLPYQHAIEMNIHCIQQCTGWSARAVYSRVLLAVYSCVLLAVYSCVLPAVYSRLVFCIQCTNIPVHSVHCLRQCTECSDSSVLAFSTLHPVYKPTSVKFTLPAFTLLPVCSSSITLEAEHSVHSFVYCESRSHSRRGLSEVTVETRVANVH